MRSVFKCFFRVVRLFSSHISRNGGSKASIKFLTFVISRIVWHTPAFRYIVSGCKRVRVYYIGIRGRFQCKLRERDVCSDRLAQCGG
jgi:hypothetical protein